eukprot:g15528.t1
MLQCFILLAISPRQTTPRGGVLAQRRAQRRVLPAAFTAVHLHPQYLSCELHGHTWTHFRHLLWQATSSESRAFVSHEWKEESSRWSCSALRSELLLEIFEMALELERGPRAAVLKKVNATNSALKLLSSAGGVCLFGYVNALAVALRIALDMNSKRCSVELLDGTFQVQQREWLRVLQTLWRHHGHRWRIAWSNQVAQHAAAAAGQLPLAFWLGEHLRDHCGGLLNSCP